MQLEDSVSLGTARRSGRRSRNRRHVVLDSSSSHQDGGQGYNPPLNPPEIIQLSSDDEEAESHRQDKGMMEETPHYGSWDPFAIPYDQGGYSMPYFSSYRYQGESSTPHNHMGEPSSSQAPKSDAERIFNSLFDPLPSQPRKGPHLRPRRSWAGTPSPSTAVTRSRRSTRHTRPASGSREF